MMRVCMRSSEHTVPPSSLIPSQKHSKAPVSLCCRLGSNDSVSLEKQEFLSCLPLHCVSRSSPFPSPPQYRVNEETCRKTSKKTNMKTIEKHAVFLHFLAVSGGILQAAEP